MKRDFIFSLLCAVAVIVITTPDGACGQLKAAYQKTDGDPTPPDFVSGPAAPELAIMILELMDTLGCQ